VRGEVGLDKLLRPIIFSRAFLAVAPRLAAQDVFHLVEAKTTVVRYEDITGEPGTADLAPFARPRPH
jgi:hypothetical protein